MRRTARACGLLLLSLASCTPAAPTASPPDPPGARTDAYSPFPSAYEALALDVARRLRDGLGGECLTTRMLRVPDAAASGVANHYEAALSGWTSVSIKAPRATIAAYRRDADRFGAATIAPSLGGWHALVVVTNTVWDEPSRKAREACPAG